MPPSTRSEVIEEINQRVDPQRLLEKLDFHREAITSVGGMLKAFCPVHREAKFKTFLIDVAKRSHRCSYRPCPAYKGGNLVDLFGLCQSIPSPLQSAFALMKFMELSLDASLLGRLGRRRVDGRRRRGVGRQPVERLAARRANLGEALAGGALLGILL